MEKNGLERSAGNIDWMSTYGQSFDARKPHHQGRHGRGLSMGDGSASPLKTSSRLSMTTTDASPPVRRGRLHLAPIEAAYVLPGSLCQLDQLGLNQDIGKAKSRKISPDRPFLALQTHDIEGANPKTFLPKLKQGRTNRRPISNMRSERSSPDSAILVKSIRPLEGMGLLEQLQTSKKPIQAPRSRYLVMGRGKSLRLYGHYEVTSKVGESLNASL